MRILADENVPKAYVAALRGDGHEVVVSRDVPQLGPEASDRAITDYAEEADITVLSTDVSDFGNRTASVAILVAPQDMSGGEVRAAVSRLEVLPFDPAESDPIWLSSL
jgi:hypothetical protein